MDSKSKLTAFLLVAAFGLVLSYDRTNCGDPPASCQTGSNERWYDPMPTSCQPECWGGSCPCYYFVAPKGYYCDEGYARLNTTDDCPGECVPVESHECACLRRLGDKCRRKGRCPQ